MSKRAKKRDKLMVEIVQVYSASRDEEQVTDLKKTDYLPYLFNLVMPKQFYKSPNRIVMARLYPDVQKHDEQAAEYFEGFQTPCFDLPTNLFPEKAPIDKIVFMPKVMLPMGFEAGGVFGPGVLPRRCYPVDLISPDHKGPMPPLFVGLRGMNVSLSSMINTFLGMYDSSDGQEPHVYEMHATNHHYKNDLAPEELMLRPDFTLSVAYTLPASMCLPSPYPYPSVPAQDNIYTPDLSKVLILMPHQFNITVAILSTVNNPHDPSVAFATMGDDEDCPEFELPSDVFPICEGVNRPIFLPKRFMPKGFDACCVFKPGSLSELWYIKSIGRFGNPQDQYNCFITPPLFVGKYTRNAASINMLEEISVHFDQKDREIAKSLARLRLDALRLNSRNNTTKGFLVMESDKPTTPAGAYSVESYEKASEDGCIAKVTQECATKSTDTRDDGMNTADYQSQFPELEQDSEPEPEPEPEPQTEDEGEDEGDKKCLSCFKIDSDIDLISHAIAEMRVAELSMLGEVDPVPGVDTKLALDQLHEVFETREEIRSNIDDLMRDHICRMERDIMLALRQPIRKCSGCAKHS
ncbi:DM7 family protein GM11958 [Drosophila sechellia]|uniref:DM7 family protein GM11958 n=1 Tax=Drosophila sechellia TaxID=7238 RepID=UPI0013DE1233|nr:DM7 family protein GM11958 [Drosophila sechellia]